MFNRRQILTAGRPVEHTNTCIEGFKWKFFWSYRRAHKTAFAFPRRCTLQSGLEWNYDQWQFSCKHCGRNLCAITQTENAKGKKSWQGRTEFHAMPFWPIRPLDLREDKWLIGASCAPSRTVLILRPRFCADRVQRGLLPLKIISKHLRLRKTADAS